MQITFPDSAEILPIDSIIVEDRLRQTSPEVQAHIEELAASIKDNGLITPITITQDNKLLVGECRYNALRLLKSPTIAVVRRNVATKSEAIILEIEENLKRKNLRWQENALGIAEAHAIFSGRAAKKFERWTQAATGKLLNTSQASVQEAVVIAKALKKGDKELSEAKSMEEAQKILTRRKAGEVAKRLASAAGSPVVIGDPERPELKARPKPAGMLTISLNTGAPVIDKPVEKLVASVTEPKLIDLKSMLFHMDNKDFFATCKNVADVIFTDIPYGIDMADLEGMDNLDTVSAEHEIDENVDQMQEFLQNAYDALKEDGWLFFYYALEHHEKLAAWGAEAGFKVQPWPLLWIKPHHSKNNAPSKRFTKNYEPIMVMRKGKATLNMPIMESTFTADHMAEKRLQQHPFAKPSAVTKWIINAVAKPGDIVIDPYAGQGSIIRALISLGMRPIAIEKKAFHFEHLVANTRQTFKALLGNKTEFILPKEIKND